jgi:histidinol phosphatase-like PHP family hydrolase
MKNMKIDLHVHARERSACAREGEESQIRAAIAAGLDGIAFTDHHRLVDARHLEDLRRRYSPFKIYTGVEITADHEDWLVIGVRDPRLESTGWNYLDLRRLVSELGGFIALAHPFRRGHNISVDIAACPPDGIEVRSSNTPVEYEAELRALARDLGLRPLQNSDAHWNDPLGRFYNLLPDSLDGDCDLVKILLGHRVH